MTTAETLAVLERIKGGPFPQEIKDSMSAAIAALQAKSEAELAWEAIEKLIAFPWSVQICKNNDGYHLAGQSENFPTPISAALAAAEAVT